MPKSYSSGNISLSKNTLKDTKEDIRLDQLIPGEIFKDKTTLEALLKAYYKFLNIDEFNYTSNETFTDTILDSKAVFRIADPELKNNKFFQQGSVTTMTIDPADGSDPISFPIIFTGSNANAQISNGNNLPESLSKSSLQRGKTLTIINTNANNLTIHNGRVATLTTVIQNHTGAGPSYALNEIERNIDIDRNDTQYLDKIAKEIAPILPRNPTVEKRTLYKQIIDFYKLRGSEDSLKTFFRLIFNDEAEIEFPIDKTLIPSSGKWETNTNLVGGGQYLDNKGFLSDTIKIHDSDKFQKFSYVIKSGQSLDSWKNSFKKLVHPAGFKFFGEILILLALVNAGNPSTQRLSTPFRKTLPQIGDSTPELFSAMPFRVPGVIGIEDIPVLVQAFAASFGPGIQVIRGVNANIQLNFHTSGPNAGKLRLMSETPPGVEIINPGSGYIALPSITFTSNSGATNPVISFGGSASDLTADGGIDPDKITIVNDGGGNPQRGANITSIVASVAGPKNASNVDMTGKIVNLRLFGQANKVYSSAPVIQFTAPTAKDADGNLTGTTATATLQLDSEGEISGFTITNPGSGYILDPDVNLITGSQNEDRVQEDFVKQILSLNHQGNLHDGTHRTIINNSMRKRQGSNATTRLYNRNATIEAFGTEEIQNFDANDINNIDIQTYINIE
tara:strand:- start:8117 stop:10144 length:2028 start_codon:yes stop_codon:yes gene_type:complete